jgi:hypothetical protein
MLGGAKNEQQGTVRAILLVPAPFYILVLGSHLYSEEMAACMLWIC